MSSVTMSKHKSDIAQLLIITIFVMAVIIYLQQTFVPENPLPAKNYMSNDEYLLSNLLAILFMAMLFVLGVGIGCYVSHWLQLREMNNLTNNL